MMRSYRLALALVLFVPGFARAQDDEARLLRFPAIHGDKLAFSYAGNLYLADANGGVARRLTSHVGYEMFARFSPDGKWLAFTGQYDGNTEVYVMPAEGGVPRRLTYTATLGRDEVSDRMGPNNIVMAWKNNDEIIFRSRMREHNDFIGQLFTISTKGGLPEQLPVPRGGFASFSPDGKKLAYNRIFREFRTWKRYRGGMADDIWVHDLESKKTEAIASDPACDTFPMWVGGRIYFLSDRDAGKRFNLYVFDTVKNDVRQLTQFIDYDIKYPSLGDKAIVFENAGYVYRFDLATEKVSKIPLRILEDRLDTRPVLTDVSKQVGAFEVSSDGKRALFSARGDLFTVPAKEGITRNLTQTSGVHDRNPKGSPDGKSIAFISDASGEDEIWTVPADGSAKPTQITNGGPPYKYALEWSPDGKKIMWADKKQRLQYVEVATKQVKLVDTATAFEIRYYSWSPDSEWIAYGKPEEKSLGKVHLYSLAKGQTFPVTDGWFDSSRPVFSGDGKYLFFVSERDFNPIYSETEWNHAYIDMSRPYFVTLSRETPSPFLPKGEDSGKDDKKAEKKEEKKDDKKDVEPKKKPAVAVKIDVEGIAERTLGLPVPPGQYTSLASVGNKLFYVRTQKKGAAPPTLFVYDLGARKETSLGAISGYEISANGEKMLVFKDGAYGIIDLPKAGPIALGDPLNLSGLQVRLDRPSEWKQMFHESWRQMRDFLYDPDLHGVDWKLKRARYEVLLPHVNHRADLSYVIGEMISELSVSHAYVGGGDLPKVPKTPMGLLGAEVKRDAKTGAYQITKILRGVPWEKALRAPLAEVGLNVKEGDYILAVNDRPTSEMGNLFESLINTVGHQVKLKVNTEPSDKGAREILVVPIGDEHPLYYHHWVQGNIKKVADATKGQVGYIHVPDMGIPGLNEFMKHFYPQMRKKALIIDVRGNGGGNVSPMLIERLRRELAMVDQSRDTSPRPDPFEMHLGPQLCLLNEFSASDGDLFPYRFRHYKLGKLVGKRSWGGTIGIRGSLPFLDGGSLNKPEFGSFDTFGKKWIIEGHGVDPDIVVDNDPWREFSGIDDQLNRAVELILADLAQNERRLPPPPPIEKR